ncbi:MAG: hypothetical protein A2Y87_10080 [Bacteroidetes bacterium RBG_13_46_8]|nr:MAG: hypothetical protein A2Y87_10080 [Bacteroidetes bacterium RBG_13_46_8]
MKKAALLFWITTAFTCVANSQDPEPVKPCIYVNSEGHIYFNRNLPVYLWISSSPEENGPAYRLMSDSSRKYSNPMYWDCEGEHTLYSPRAVDAVLKQAANPQSKVVFHVTADSKAPVTRARLSGKTMITRSGVNFYSGKLAVSLSATDVTSGISSTYVSLNGKPFEKYTGPLTAEADGEYSLSYYSVDVVGNREETKEGKFALDNSAPVTSYSFDGLEDNKITPKTKLVLKSSDGLSGVKTIYYRINQGPETVYTRPLPAGRLADGISSVSFYAVDNLSNREQPQTVTGELKGADR